MHGCRAHEGHVAVKHQHIPAKPGQRAFGLLHRMAGAQLRLLHGEHRAVAQLRLQLLALLAKVTNENAAGEFYLVDVVNVANAEGRHSAVVVTADPHEVDGINSRAELAQAEALWQARRRKAAMDDGVSLIAPETVWFAWDTVLGSNG